jgi:hypothetical protein
MNTDSEIQENVTDALDWDAAVDSSKLTVSVRDNLVTLGGQVCNYSGKMEARRAAQCIAGVRAVIDRIDVVPLDAGIDSQTLDAVVMRWFWVSLSGAVDWNYRRKKASNGMCFLADVQGFINHMTLNGAGD